MKHPTLDNKPFDMLRKEDFDAWRKHIAFVIKLSETKLTQTEIETIAWNVAFEIVSQSCFQRGG